MHRSQTWKPVESPLIGKRPEQPNSSDSARPGGLKTPGPITDAEANLGAIRDAIAAGGAEANAEERYLRRQFERCLRSVPSPDRERLIEELAELEMRWRTKDSTEGWPPPTPELWRRSQRQRESLRSWA